MSGRVWLVTKGELEDLEIVAAAPTKPLADEMARLANGDRFGDPDDDWWEGYDVREVPLIVSVDDGVRWYQRECRVVGDGRIVDELADGGPAARSTAAMLMRVIGPKSPAWFGRSAAGRLLLEVGVLGDPVGASVAAAVLGVTRSRVYQLAAEGVVERVEGGFSAGSVAAAAERRAGS